jgi:hypothetical protein
MNIPQEWAEHKRNVIAALPLLASRRQARYRGIVDPYLIPAFGFFACES